MVIPVDLHLFDESSKKRGRQFGFPGSGDPGGGCCTGQKSSTRTLCTIRIKVPYLHAYTVRLALLLPLFFYTKTAVCIVESQCLRACLVSSSLFASLSLGTDLRQ